MHMTAIRWIGAAITVAAGVLAAAANDDGWLGDAKKDVPVETNVSLVKERLSIAGAEVWPLTVDPASLIGGPHFSDDGQWLYLLHWRGVVRKIETATMTERVRLSLAVPCDHMGISKAGLVIAARSRSEAPLPESEPMWVVSPDTLEVLRTVPVVRTSRTWLATSPALDSAYLTSVVVSRTGRPPAVPLAQFNARTGRLSVAQWVDGKDGSKTDTLGRQPVIAPDGKFAFAADSGGLVRYRVDGARLIYDDRTRDQRTTGTRGKAHLTAGGRYVFCPTLSGNLEGQITGRPGIYVYNALKLDAPVTVLPARDSLTLDLARKRAFALADRRVIGLDLQGRERWNCTLPDAGRVGGGPSSGIWMAPGGKGMLVHVATLGLFWLRVPDEVMLVREEGDDGPPPAEAGEGLSRTPTRTTDGYSVTHLSLRPQDVVRDPLLDAAGAILTVLSPDGMVRQYDTAGGKFLRALNVGRRCVALGRSAEGFVLLAQNPGEIWVLDESTLAVRRRIPVAAADEMASSEALPWGVVLSDGPASTRLVALVDFRSGRLTQAMDTLPDMHSAAREGPTASKRFQGKRPRLTPDGLNLFTFDTSLHRWRRDGSQLMWAASVPQSSSAIGGWSISDDGAYLSVSRPKSAIFWTEDIAEPVLADLTPGPTQFGSGPVALDSSRRKCYVVSREVLYVFDALGQEEAAVFLPEPPENLPEPWGQMSHDALRSAVQQQRRERGGGDAGLQAIALASKAGKMLVLTGHDSAWVELPPAAANAAPVGPMGQWLGDAALQTRLAAQVRGTSAAIDVPLPADEREVEGATVVILDEKADEIVAEIPWTADGAGFFLLRKDGLLRQIALDPIREVRRLQLPQPCHALAKCEHGLLLGGSRYGDVYLVDEQTLELRWKQEISPGPIGRIFAAAAGEYALVEASDAAPPLRGPPSRLVAVALEYGKVAQENVPAKLKVPRYRLNEGPPRDELRTLLPIQTAVLHPDGGSLWTAGTGGVQSYTLARGVSMLVPGAGAQWIRFDSPPTMATPPRLSWLRFNADGRYFLIHSADKIRDFPKHDYAATFIFNSAKPDKPLVTIEHDVDNGSVAFADATKLLFEYTWVGRLRVYHGNGDLLKEFPVNVQPDHHDDPRFRTRYSVECLSVQPDGRGLIAMTRHRIVYVRLPEDVY